MKSFLILVVFLCMHQAFAEGVSPLKKGDLSISEAHAEIVSVRAYCPVEPGRPTCSAYGSVVKVKVTLNGCMDRFGGHFSHFEMVDGKGVLHFAAINIFNEASRVTLCVKAPTETVSVYVPFEGHIELVNMEYTGTTRPVY